MFPYTIATPDKVMLSHLIWDTNTEGDGEVVRFWYDGLYYQLELSPDHYQTLNDATEYYGKLTRSDSNDYLGDRVNGILYGPSQPFQQIFTDEAEANKFYDELYDLERERGGVRLVDSLDFDDHEFDDEGEPISWIVEWHERPILAEDIWTNPEINDDDFPYWIPSPNLEPPENTEDEVAMDNFIDSLKGDWKTLEDYGHGWHMAILDVKVFANSDYEDGEEIGSTPAMVVEKAIGYIPPSDLDLAMTHNWFALDQQTRARLRKRGVTWDESFFEAAAESAWIAADNASLLYRDKLSEWPPQLVWLRDVLVWIGQFCNFARTDVLDPDNLEEVDPGTYQIFTEVVCRANLEAMQRKIVNELIPQLAGYLEAQTEIGREGDAVVLTVLVRDTSTDTNYEIIMEVFDERLFLGPYEVEIPVPEAREPILRKSSVFQERGGYPSLPR